MKRKTIILLSSVLAGSLLVGGAFAAYAVTDNADPIGVDVKTQAPDQDTPVTLTWGAKEHANIPDLDSGKYAKAGYFTVKSDIAYEGIFSVKMEDKTPQAIIDAKGTESPVFLFDNLEVFVYSGNVVLTDGELPAELPAGVELVGSISTNQAAVDGVKTWSKTVASDLDGKVFSVLVKSEATDDLLGQLSQDVVRLTIDWGMGADSHEAEPVVIENGYYLVGTFNEWAMQTSYKLDFDSVKNEYSKMNVVFGEAAEIKVVGHYDQDTYFPASDEEDDHNIPLAAGTYDIYFRSEYYEDWKTGSEYQGQYGVAGHFWIAPQNGEPQPQPSEKSYYLVGSFTEWQVDDEYVLAANTSAQGEYFIQGVEFKAGDELKVVDSANTWYPDGMDNAYVFENGGTYDVYFRPDGQGAQDWWHGYFYVAAAQ